MERSPWTFNAILAVAAKIRSGNGPLTPTFYKCLEEAQAIARASLFGPVVRKEAVQGSFFSCHHKPRKSLLIDPFPSGMLLLSAWSANGWLPSGHAMRMALDLGLHRALEKLADTSGQQRREEEERDLSKMTISSRSPYVLTSKKSSPLGSGFVCIGLIISKAVFHGIANSWMSNVRYQIEFRDWPPDCFTGRKHYSPL